MRALSVDHYDTRSFATRNTQRDGWIKSQSGRIRVRSREPGKRKNQNLKNLSAKPQPETVTTGVDEAAQSGVAPVSIVFRLDRFESFKATTLAIGHEDTYSHARFVFLLINLTHPENLDVESWRQLTLAMI